MGHTLSAFSVVSVVWNKDLRGENKEKLREFCVKFKMSLPSLMPSVQGVLQISFHKGVDQFNGSWQGIKHYNSLR